MPSIAWRIYCCSVALMFCLTRPSVRWAAKGRSSASYPKVLAETANYLRINMMSEPFLALGTILSGAITGAGDTRATMWIIVACMWGVRLPLAYILAITLGYGPTGVWVAMVISMMCYALFMSLRFRGGPWKHIRVD